MYKPGQSETVAKIRAVRGERAAEKYVADQLNTLQDEVNAIMHFAQRTCSKAFSDFIDSIDLDSVAIAVRGTRNIPLPAAAEEIDDDSDSTVDPAPIKDTRYEDLYNAGILHDDNDGEEEEDDDDHQTYEDEPGDSTTEDSTTEDSTTEDSTTEDSTTEDSTTEDSTTEDSTTEDSTTEDSTTEDSTTED
ncbi:hypothetical protein MMC11_007064, partial [Xylographa trunciseda]|nr:hypothetical protein [Xylographa trunciseda]